MAIRNGRFKTSAATSGIIIVDGNVGAIYRILNSGDEDFTIDDGSGSTITLAKKFSIDVGVEAAITVSSTAAIEGIYELVDTARSIRSGRFRIKGASSKHKIIDISGGSTGRPTVVYRIFNSGKSSFDVFRGTTKIRTLEAEHSFDFEIPAMGNKNIFVAPTTNGDTIQGIYDFLK